MKESLKLGNIAKVFPLALLTSAALLAFMYFLHKGNASDSEQMMSLGLTVVLLIAFLFLYALQNKVIAMEYLSELQDEEPPSIKELASDFKSYFPSSAGMLIAFGIIYSLILPTIGSMAGGLFQISVAGIEFNILTLLLNLMVIAWLMFATAQVNIMEAGIVDTIKFIPGFVFTNFGKVVKFILVFILCLFCLQMLIVSTATSSQMVAMPVKAVAIGYVLAFLNAYAANIFLDNIEDDDFSEDADY